MNCIDTLLIRTCNMIFVYGFSFCKSLGSGTGTGKSGDSSKKALEKNPFDYLSDTDVAGGEKGGNFAILGSIYRLLLVIGITGLIVSIISIGIKLQLFKGAAKREESKSELGFKSVIAVLFFSVLTLAGAWHEFLVNLF